MSGETFQPHALTSQYRRPIARVAFVGMVAYRVAGWICLYFGLRRLWSAGRDIFDGDGVVEQAGPLIIGHLLIVLACFLVGMANVLGDGAYRNGVGIVPHGEVLEPMGYSLYLRSFEEDNRLAAAQRLPSITTLVRMFAVVPRSEEYQLIHALTSDDPMITVGIPDEIDPVVGAWRLYLPADNWREPVVDLMREARLVVLVLSSTPGVMWELGEAMRTLPAERLLLIVAMDRHEYEEFRKLAAAELRSRARRLQRATGERWSPPRLPDYAGRKEISSRVQGVIYFSPDWEPCFVRLRAYTLFHNYLQVSLVYAVRPVFERLGLRIDRPGALPHRGVGKRRGKRIGILGHPWSMKTLGSRDKLGPSIRRHETNSVRRGWTALIVTAGGTLSVLLALRPLSVLQQTVTLDRLIQAVSLAGPGLLFLWMGISYGWRHFTRPCEVFTVHEGGLVCDHAGLSRAIAWNEIAWAKHRHQPYRDQDAPQMRFARALGWDVHFVIKLKGGGSVVVTGFTEDARELGDTVVQAVHHDNPPTPAGW